MVLPVSIIRIHSLGSLPVILLSNHPEQPQHSGVATGLLPWSFGPMVTRLYSFKRLNSEVKFVQISGKELPSTTGTTNTDF